MNGTTTGLSPVQRAGPPRLGRVPAQVPGRSSSGAGHLADRGSVQPLHGADPVGGAERLPGAACGPAPVLVNAPGMALPSRPQPAGVDARRWVPPDPEILRRVRAALARL